MIPYAPSFFAILLLGNFLPEAHLGRALHHSEGGPALLVVLAATLVVLLLVPLQQLAIRWLEARLGARAWAAASLGLMLAVCAGEMAVFAAALDASGSLLGG